jgi:hypothetical protein
MANAIDEPMWRRWSDAEMLAMAADNDLAKEDIRHYASNDGRAP